MQNNHYKTQCLETAAAIMTAGAKLVCLEKIQGRKSLFVFKKNDRLEKILSLHTSQQLNLPSHLILANLKFLKTRVKESNPARF
ncbi:hypothetical protein HOM98_04980 [Candidatus Peregrinibacteria bacterium]|nr:hypothetical protein [Candidatus Peregrinibacteria bacterium]